MGLLDQLVSYWKLDEASGDAIDAHGTNNLTDNNTVGSAVGKISNARDFEATTTEYFSSASTPSLQVGDIDFTWAMWVNMESTGSFRILFRKGDATTALREYTLFYRNSATRFEFQVGNGSALSTVVTSAGITTGTWYFVVCWHDSAQDKIFISIDNGTAAFSAHAGGVLTGTGAFEIGAGSDQSLWWDGLIDEVGFWKRLLTEQERTDLYNSGAGLSYDEFGGGGDTPSTKIIELACSA